MAIFDQLLSYHGPQRWWPNSGPSRADYICTGAILCQNTAWRNAAAALERLERAGLTAVADLAQIDTEELAELIRPAGYFRQKSRKLKEFASLADSHGGLSGLLELDTANLRRELLGCWGIGPETADAILLFAARRATLVIDTYAVRTWSRVGLLEEDVDREALRAALMEALNPDAEFAAEYHALLIQHGKNHCRARPLCGDCPLRGECAYRARHPDRPALGRARNAWSGGD